MTTQLDPVHANLDLRCEVHMKGSYTLECGTTPAAYVLHEYRHGLPNVPIAACKVHASAQARRKWNAHPLTPMTPDAENDIRARLQAAARASSAERDRRNREHRQREQERAEREQSLLPVRFTPVLDFETSTWDGRTVTPFIAIRAVDADGSYPSPVIVSLEVQERGPAFVRLSGGSPLTLLPDQLRVLAEVLPVVQEWADAINYVERPRNPESARADLYSE